MMMRCGDGRNYGRNYDRFKNISGFWWEMLNTPLHTEFGCAGA
jgi:hypothetical protein